MKKRKRDYAREIILEKTTFLILAAIYGLYVWLVN